MRLALALIFILALAGPGLAQGTRSPSIDLARVGGDHLIGQKWMALKSGAFCIPGRTLEWAREDEEGFSQSDILQKLFRTEMSAAGYRIAGDTSDLFASKTENADFQIGALIKAIHVDLCVLESEYKDYQKGSATMDVEWQVYSVQQGKVVARIPTHGELKVGLSSDGRVKLLRGVFSQAIQGLASSAEFRQLLTSASVASAPTTGAPSLSIRMPATSKPMAIKDTVGSVALVLVGTGHGSAVLISPDGYLLTNHHVAGDSGRVRLRWPDGSETVADVVRGDKRRDVALLKTDAPKARPLAIRHGPVDTGETVYAIGTPLDKDLSNTVSRGVVSAGRRDYQGQPYIQSDVGVTHGNSGGPLIDEKGFVVGLTDLGLHAEEFQGLNLFIPIDEALKALAVTPGP